MISATSGGHGRSTVAEIAFDTGGECASPVGDSAGEVFGKCVVVIGPTATGKTALAVALARGFSGEIISADSRQVYRGLTIGSGKDLAEYGVGDKRVAYHLIDVADPKDEYHLFRFVGDARQAIAQILSGGGLPIIAGGTALYINALLDNYTLEGGEPIPELRAELDQRTTSELIGMLGDEAPDVLSRTDLTQRSRIVRGIEIARSRSEVKCGAETQKMALLPLILAPFYPRSVVHQRIEARLDERLSSGMIEEVTALHRDGLSWERLDLFGLEYRYVAKYLQGMLPYEQMRATLLARIRRFCRAQDIWFRKMERAGKDIYWLPEGNPVEAAELVARFLAGEKLPAPRIRLNDVYYGPKSN